MIAVELCDVVTRAGAGGLRDIDGVVRERTAGGWRRSDEAPDFQARSTDGRTTTVEWLASMHAIAVLTRAAAGGRRRRDGRRWWTNGERADVQRRHAGVRPTHPACLMRNIEMVIVNSGSPAAQWAPLV